jgi:hypothetical protein
MSKENNSIVDADPKAIDRWDDEGGAQGTVAQTKRLRVEDEESYLKRIRPYSDAISKILRKVRSELRTRWETDAQEQEGSE